MITSNDTYNFPIHFIKKVRYELQDKKKNSQEYHKAPSNTNKNQYAVKGIETYLVTSFTDKIFTGNPAEICLLGGIMENGIS